jgi:hypothetical protein
MTQLVNIYSTPATRSIASSCVATPRPALVEPLPHLVLAVARPRPALAILRFAVARPRPALTMPTLAVASPRPALRSSSTTSIDDLGLFWPQPLPTLATSCPPRRTPVVVPSPPVPASSPSVAGIGVGEVVAERELGLHLVPK